MLKLRGPIIHQIMCTALNECYAKYVHNTSNTHYRRFLDYKIISSDEHPEISNFNSLRCDQHNDPHHQQRQHKSRGLLLFIHQDFHLIKHYNVNKKSQIHY